MKFYIFFCSFDFSQKRLEKISKYIEIYANIIVELEKNYTNEIDFENFCNDFFNFFLKKINIYNDYISFEENDDSFFLQKENDLKIFLGLEIEEKNDEIFCSKVFKNCCAHKTGIKVSDQIVKVNDVYVTKKNIKKIINLIKNSNSEITFEIKRMYKENLVLNLQKKYVYDFNPYFFTIIKKNVAYIKLDNFDSESSKFFHSILINLNNFNVENLIIDLRDNFGGIIQEVIEIINLFFSDKKLVLKTISESGKTLNEYFTEEKENDFFKFKIIVLVNNKTVSAAEIFAGMIQDLDLGFVIGEKTYGKGCVQIVKDVGYQNKIKIIHGNYFLPSGRRVLNNNEKEEKDSKDFKTLKNRKIKETIGIVPDIILDKKINKTLNFLSEKDLFREFIMFMSSKKKLTLKEIGSDTMIKNFIKWSIYSKNILEDLICMKDMSKEINNLNDLKVKKKFDSFKSSIENDIEKILIQNKFFLKKNLEIAFCEHENMYEGKIEQYIKNDSFINKALEIFEKKDFLK